MPYNDPWSSGEANKNALGSLAWGIFIEPAIINKSLG
jgi:hypothetical protein